MTHPFRYGNTTLHILYVAVAYYISGKLGTLLAVPPGYATAIWPPSGIALAGVLIYGNRVWPGILLGSFLINLQIASTGNPHGMILSSVAIALLISSGATLQALSGSYLLRRFAGFPNPLSTPKEVELFMLIGGLGSALINSTISVSTLVAVEKVPVENFLTNWGTWWAGDAIGICIFTPLILAWLLHPTSAWKHRRVVITFTILAMFSLTTLLVAYESQKENEHLKSEFENQSARLGTALEKSLFTHINEIKALESFYSASKEVGRDEFRTFVNHSLSNFNGIQALEWAPIVSSSERKSFEMDVAREGYRNFKVSERNAKNELISADSRSEYVPVTFVEPYQGNEAALGYDLYSNEVRRAAIIQARDTGEVAVTRRIVLVQEHGKQFGILAFIPVYQNGLPHQSIEDRRRNIRGYLLAVFRGGDIVTAAFKDFNLKGLSFRLIDSTAPAEDQLLFSNDVMKINSLGFHEKGLFGGNIQIKSSLDIPVGGHLWRLEVVPKQEYFSYLRSDNAWLILLLGFFLTSVVGSFVILLSGRGNVLRRLVDERTEALSESEERFRATFENAPLGVALFTLDGHYQQVNHRYCEFIGYTQNELLTMSFREITDPSFYSSDAEIVRCLLTGEISSFSIEKVYVRKDGRAVWGNASGSLIRNSDSSPRSIIVVVEDIDQRKKTDGELRIAATAFETQEGMLVTDANGDILRVNHAFTTITGYSADEVVGKNPRLLSSGRHDAVFYEAMWSKISSEGAWEGEIWNRRKSGEVYPEHLTITAVKDSMGNVTNYVATLTDITLNKAAAEKIEHLAFYDPLTKLPNRRLLIDRLQQAFASSARSGKTGALLFIDLDNFKNLNDTLGHDTGDLLLQQVAERLSACTREGDTVSRFGGDEFVVMLEELSEQQIEAAAQAEAIGNKILASLNKPYELGAHPYHSTPSIGITLFNDHEHETEDLLKQADLAMYQAKNAGRNALRFFDPKMQENINQRTAIERELRLALKKEQFQLYYQIQVDSEGHALGAEALIRWIHPERGLVSPAQFIPVAEETGLILPVGQWVLETACAQIKAWEKDERTRELVLSVNVSARQFRQSGFVTQIQTIIERFAINPTKLKLELTESILLESIEDTISTMNALNDVGVQFSLDDFGTGYSSLQYLKKLPLGQLKIDQSFVRDITFDEQDRSIVRTVIAMARSLELEVIAEGVETEEQKQRLMNSGCTHYQGYLFSKPVPVEHFERLLNQGGK